MSIAVWIGVFGTAASRSRIGRVRSSSNCTYWAAYRSRGRHVVLLVGVDGVAFDANGMPVAVDAPHSAIVTEFSKMNLIS